MRKQRTTPPVLAATILFLALGFLVGCDGNESDLPQEATVRIPAGTNVPGCETTDTCFTPPTVRVGVGGTVTWHNDDTSAHTVTGGTPEEGPSGTFDSSLIIGGGTFAHPFDAAGTFSYYCLVHPWQRGTVMVEE